MPSPSPSEPSAGSGDAAAPRVADPATITTLANGMQVVVLTDRRSPIVTHMVWYRNGSSDDPVGKSGIAHFLEHLMFKGTRTYPPGHFTEILAAVGGTENAFTTHDFTVYYQRVPAEYLATCMAYEADRMTNLTPTQEEVASERDVILAERGMITDSDPSALLDEAVAAMAFPAHPSGRPIIGWRHEIAGLGREDALTHYRRFYAPENAVIVVAGNAEARRVLAMAEAAYGAIPAAGGPLERRRVQDPPARTHRRLTLADAAVRQPRLVRLYPVPSCRNAGPGEAEAFEVLATLLGGGPTSILYTRLVLERACATAVGVWHTGRYFLDDARLQISATPAEGIAPEGIDGMIQEILQSLTDTGFAAQDIARAKLRLVADTLYACDSQVSLAEWYGSALVCGCGFDHPEAWQARIEAVTPEALRAALLKLDRQSGVSGYLVEAAGAA